MTSFMTPTVVICSSAVLTLVLVQTSSGDFLTSGETSFPFPSSSSSSSSSYSSDANDIHPSNVTNNNHRVLAISDEKQLTKDLLRIYATVGKGGRPVHNTSTTTVIVLGLGLIQLEVDERDKILITSMWVKLKWKDEYLTWNPDDYGGVEKIRVHASDIWVPDVMLINTAVPKFEIRNDILVVEYGGNVTWISHQIFRSSCAPNIRNFPFDHQQCYMWFASWTHTVEEIALELDSTGLDIGTFQADFSESCKWDVTHVKAIQFVPVDSNQYVLSFFINFKRKTMFSSYILTLPCVFLATLTLVVFWLPPERPDRTTLAMSIFASFLFLLLILVETAPPTAASVPKLAFYYCFNMVIIIVSIFLSSFVVNIHKTAAEAKHPVPRWLDILILQCLSRIVCVRVGCRVSRSSSRDYHRPSMSRSPVLQPLTGTKSSFISDHISANGSSTLTSSDQPFPLEIPMMVGRSSALLEGCADGGGGGGSGGSGGGAGTGGVGGGSGMTRMGGVERLLLQIEAKLMDVVTCLESVASDKKQKQEQDMEKRKIVEQWKSLAVVIDRFFFHAYFVLILLSLVVLFPRPNNEDSQKYED